VLDEYIGYHRINGLINKIDDDLLSAIRVGLMDLRYAKPLGSGGPFDRGNEQQQIARNVDFDVFSGQPFGGGGQIARGTDFDPFDA